MDKQKFLEVLRNNKSGIIKGVCIAAGIVALGIFGTKLAMQSHEDDDLVVLDDVEAEENDADESE